MTDHEYKIPSSVEIDGSRVTEPLTPEAMKAMRRWEETKTDELIAVLAPYGLHPYDLDAPDWRRIVTPAEVRTRLRGFQW